MLLTNSLVSTTMSGISRIAVYCKNFKTGLLSEFLFLVLSKCEQKERTYFVQSICQNE